MTKAHNSSLDGMSPYLAKTFPTIEAAQKLFLRIDYAHARIAEHEMGRYNPDSFFFALRSLWRAIGAPLPEGADDGQNILDVARHLFPHAIVAHNLTPAEELVPPTGCAIHTISIRALPWKSDGGVVPSGTAFSSVLEVAWAQALVRLISHWAAEWTALKLTEKTINETMIDQTERKIAQGPYFTGRWTADPFEGYICGPVDWPAADELFPDPWGLKHQHEWDGAVQKWFDRWLRDGSPNWTTLAEENKRLADDFAKVRADCQKRDAENKELQHQLMQAAVEKAKLHDQIRILRGNNANQSSLIKRLAAEKDDATRRNTNQFHLITKMEEKTEELGRALAKLHERDEAQCDLIAQMEREVAELRANNREMEADMLDAMRQLDQAEKRIADQQVQIAVARSRSPHDNLARDLRITLESIQEFIEEELKKS